MYVFTFKHVCVVLTAACNIAFSSEVVISNPYDPCSTVRCLLGQFCIGGTCVDICRKPKIFELCPTSCPTTCGDIDAEEPVICPARCRQLQCVCSGNFVELSKRNTKCVRPAECPCFKVHCGKNEKCIEGVCKCVRRYWRNKSGVCEKYCISQTPPKSVCRDGNYICIKGYIMIKKLCHDKCITMKCGINTDCKEGKCSCSRGFRRRSDGSCTKKCVGRKTYEKCPTSCPKTCDNPNPEFCTKDCRKEKCVCKKGFIEKSALDNACVRPKQCKNKCTFKDCPKNTFCLSGKCLCKKGFRRYKKNCVKLCGTKICKKYNN